MPDNSLIYCDPPYKGTKEYNAAKKSGFNSEDFWEWCTELTRKKHKVFVSEYTAPDEWVCIWERGFSSSMRANGVITGDKKSIERLFVHRDFYNEWEEKLND